MIKCALGDGSFLTSALVSKRNGARPWFAVLSLALAAAGCAGDGGSTGDSDAPAADSGSMPSTDGGSSHLPPDSGMVIDDAGMMTNDPNMMMDKPHGTVSGFVYRADTLKPVAGALISGPDGIKAMTDKRGKFVLTMLETERVALLANAKNFAQAVEPVTVIADQSASVEFRLLKVSAKADVDSSKGGKVRAASGAEVVIDKGAFVGADGKPVKGMVTVELTVLDPSNAAGLQAFPGDFAATTKSGGDGQLESFVPMEVTVKQGDEVLDFAGGKGAQISFPVPASLKDKAPQTIALWSLSETTGAWVEEGTATLVTDGAGMLVYRGRLTHMSWWNCDRFIDSVTCIRGCVTRDGAPATNVQTQAEGIDYSNLGIDWTGGDGCFAEDVKAGAQLRVRALTDDATTEWKVITAPETRMSVRDPGSKCKDIGTLEMVARKAADMGCPSGTTKCGDKCVDVASDYDNCGQCGNSCFGKTSGAQCIAGQCACAASQTKCASADGPMMCTDVAFDEANCGKCGKRCGDGQSCESGTCKQIACADGLSLCGSGCVDLAVNSLNCGQCGSACAPGATCGGGTCKALTCPTTTEKCGNECVAKGTCPKGTDSGTTSTGGDGGNGGTSGSAGSGGSDTGSAGSGGSDTGNAGSGSAGSGPARVPVARAAAAVAAMPVAVAVTPVASAAWAATRAAEPTPVARVAAAVAAMLVAVAVTPAAWAAWAATRAAEPTPVARVAVVGVAAAVPAMLVAVAVTPAASAAWAAEPTPAARVAAAVPAMLVVAAVTPAASAASAVSAASRAAESMVASAAPATVVSAVVPVAIRTAASRIRCAVLIRCRATTRSSASASSSSATSRPIAATARMSCIAAAVARAVLRRCSCAPT